MNEKRIPIILAANDAYAPYISVTVNSLVSNSSKSFFYDIYVFHTDLCENNVTLLNSMRGENYSVSCLCVERFIEQEKKYMYTNFHFSKEMFYRILIPTILENYDKAIYLDCDTVVLGDISELYETDLEGYVIAAGRDILHGRSRSYVIDELGIDPDEYINSGVLVINCKAYRDLGIKSLIFEELKTRASLRYPDQDLINLVCNGRIKYLDSAWNYIWHYNFIKDDPTLNLPDAVMPEYLKMASDAKIIHYTSSIKPWKNKNSPLSDYFWKYTAGTPFEKKISSDFKKISGATYIGYHFIDEADSGFDVTFSLYTIEGLKPANITLFVDGKDKEATYLYTHVIEIADKAYNRSFFRFTIDPQELSDVSKITVYNSITGEPISIRSATTFPIEFALAESLEIGGRILFKDSRSLVFAKPTPEIKTKLKAERRLAEDKLKNNYVFKKARKLKALYTLLRPFFRKDIWLISDRGSSAGDNGEALFRYLSENCPKGIKPVFVINKLSPDFKRLKKYGKVVPLGSVEHKIYYLFTTANISSHLEKSVANPVFAAKYLKTTLPKCHNVLLQHGIIKDDLSFSYNRCKDNLSVFITSARSEYDSIVSNPNYNCPPSVTKLTGLARYDLLENTTERIIFILPTWRKNCTEDIVSGDLIANVEESSYFKFYSSLLHDERFIAAAKKHGYRICYYPHPMMSALTEKFGTFDRIFAKADEFSYNDVFCRGALMLTDYSSAQFDFAYLKKPIVYTQFDKEEFYSSHTYKQGYFDYETDGFGEVEYTKDATVDRLIEYMENGCAIKDEYRVRSDEFFAFDDKNNCKRITDEILKINGRRF